MTKKARIIEVFVFVFVLFYVGLVTPAGIDWFATGVFVLVIAGFIELLFDNY